jgi:hypothetical protein
LANSLVVQTDETGWSIHSVWAFLSEKVRVVLFGVHKDAATLAELLDPANPNGRCGRRPRPVSPAAPARPCSGPDAAR